MLWIPVSRFSAESNSRFKACGSREQSHHDGDVDQHEDLNDDVRIQFGPFLFRPTNMRQYVTAGNRSPGITDANDQDLPAARSAQRSRRPLQRMTSRSRP
eukprot:3409928-Rhodomonas_salina.5